MPSNTCFSLNVFLLQNTLMLHSLTPHLSPPQDTKNLQTHLLSMDSVKKSSGDEPITTVDVRKARNLLDQGHRYLDVRTEEEFKKGHIENGVCIPYMFNTPQGRVKNPKFMDQVLAVFRREEKLVVGCQSGVRSVSATSDLLQAGFKDVCNMGGGYLHWVASGFPVKNPPHTSPSGEGAIPTVDAHEARNLLNQGYRYLDVRTEEDFKNDGHVENAFNVPYLLNTPRGRVKNPLFLDQVLAVCRREGKLVVGCRSGGRSVSATSDLLQADFKNVCNMGGGYNQWVASGFPVEKPPHISV